MKKLMILLVLLCLSGCAQPEPAPSFSETIAPTTLSIPETIVTEPTVTETEVPTQPPADLIEEMVKTLSVEEKIGQLFLARYDSSHASDHGQRYHLGGWILFSGDFEGETPESISREIEQLQQAAAIPMLMAVDEEGGSVTRISRYASFRDKKFPSYRTLYQTGGTPLLLETEAEKCQLLTSLGLNVNMGPVCDITTEPSAFMYSRSLGQDPQTTGSLVAAIVEVMTEHQTGSVLKHFPGYGNNADTHVGIARDSRALDTLEAADLVPFRAGIDAGCDAILVSHTIVEALDSSLPASLSPAVIGYLRTKLGFEGVAVTDDLVMEAITDTYGAGESAVLAVLAGNDLLCSTEYAVQYEAVLAAVEDGRIPMERIDEAVTRILRWKQKLGLLTF